MAKTKCPPPICTTKDGLKTCKVITPDYDGGGCRERKRSEFDSRSFFFKPSGNSMILIGCRKGDWDAEAHKCKRGTRAIQSVTAV